MGRFEPASKWRGLGLASMGLKTVLAPVVLMLFVADFRRGVAQTSNEPKTQEQRREFKSAMGTLLTWDGDITSKMIAGVDKFLLRKLAESPRRRDNYWSGSGESYAAKVSTSKAKLAHILGVRDKRPSQPTVELIQTVNGPEALGRTGDIRVLAVRWRSIEDHGPPIYGEGILLEPKEAKSNVILIPDADQSPEQLANEKSTVHLASSGCRVVIPSLIGRRVQRRRSADLTDREYLYRPSFELGRHVVGYELQKIFTLLDWFAKNSADLPVGVYGWGEGGRLAMYASALDDRIDAFGISSYFGPREAMWEEPIDRNVFGLLNHFGDAELIAMALEGETKVILENKPFPTKSIRTKGGAPYTLKPTSSDQFEKELARIPAAKQDSVVVGDVMDFAKSLGVLLSKEPPTLSIDTNEKGHVTRQERQIAEIVGYNEALLEGSPYVRKSLFANHDVSSLETHAKTIENYRDMFRDDVIGRFDEKLLPLNPRSREVFNNEKWTGYEVVLDVFPDVFAFGILLVPKDIEPDEKRPVVVCQHGLEGRPRNVIEKDHYAYHDYAAKLAERGFITFAPQNIYIFEDRFRTLQRKANPLGKTLFSVMVPQHQQIVNWLGTLPQVDPDRVAFYGLSYGGKSAMRIPPLVDGYCLSICSADFNDWVWKNASTVSPYSYTWMGEYEIFEWDLGSTFNYAEMAALIAPRPFMVERGHFDGVAPDDRVAKEFAKVRHLYQAKLGIGDRCEIEFFVGPHTINGKGSFEFLHRHLNWPHED